MLSSLKARLKARQPTLGSWITLGHPAIAEIMARAGFDWLVVDLEHSTITIEQAEHLIRVIELCGVVPLVRLTANDPAQVKRVMDAGAHGVVVPMVNSPQAAEAAVAAVRYPPGGTRSVGLARAQGYGVAFAAYLEWLERESVIIVQIEHQDAVATIEQIFDVPGIDGYILGPYDLSASLGYAGQFDHPLVTEAVTRVRDSAQRRAMPGGIHVIEPDVEETRKRFQEGFCFVAYSLDIRMLDRQSRAVRPLLDDVRRGKA